MALSILQWNVQSSEDIRKIGEFLERNPVDVVCLQELTVDYEMQAVADTPGYVANVLNCEYFSDELSPNDPTTRARVVNGIFSRLPIIHRHSELINDGRLGGGFDAQQRGYVEVTVVSDGKHVTIGTSHMSYTDAFEQTQSKQQETDRLVQILASRGERFVFAADLNAVPESYTVSRIQQHLRNAGPAGGQATWTTKPFRYRGFEAHELHWRLDYVFVSFDVAVRKAQIVDTDCSDHLPILVEIEI